jgi:hypothetical protein
MKKLLFGLIATVMLSLSSFAQEVANLPKDLESLKKMVSSPDKLDSACQTLKIEPKLVNYNLATPVNMRDYGLSGEGVHLPVQISDKFGGRSSIYLLKPGQEVMTGLFIVGKNMYLRSIKRLTGNSTVATDGDEFQERLTSLDGRELFNGKGALKIRDISYGYGEINFANKTSPTIWIIWSAIYIQNM